jgi:hypothetical protein
MITGTRMTSLQHRERASPINACVHVLPAGASRSEDGVRFRRELAFY